MVSNNNKSHNKDINNNNNNIINNNNNNNNVNSTSIEDVFSTIGTGTATAKRTLPKPHKTNRITDINLKNLVL